MTVQVISAFFAIIAFSVVNNVPRKFLFSCGVEGFVGWYVYLLFLSDTGPVMANFFGSLALAIMAHVFARTFKAPVTVFLIAGIFPLVPGTRIYWTAYYAVTDQLALAQQNGFAALKDALAIVLGIVVIFELPNRLFRLLARKNRA